MTSAATVVKGKDLLTLNPPKANHPCVHMSLCAGNLQRVCLQHRCFCAAAACGCALEHVCMHACTSGVTGECSMSAGVRDCGIWRVVEWCSV